MPVEHTTIAIDPEVSIAIDPVARLHGITKRALIRRYIIRGLKQDLANMEDIGRDTVEMTKIAGPLIEVLEQREIKGKGGK